MWIARHDYVSHDFIICIDVHTAALWRLELPAFVARVASGSRCLSDRVCHWTPWPSRTLVKLRSSSNHFRTGARFCVPQMILQISCNDYFHTRRNIRSILLVASVAVVFALRRSCLAYHRPAFSSWNAKSKLFNAGRFSVAWKSGPCLAFFICNGCVFCFRWGYFLYLLYFICRLSIQISYVRVKSTRHKKHQRQTT